jgi:hypothetical protein
LDSIQRRYKARIQILGITDQQKYVIQQFLKKREDALGFKLTFPIVTNDTILANYFKHVYIPHIIWINPEGIIMAITSGNEVTQTNVERAIQSNFISLPEKTDPATDRDFISSQPLFLNNNGGNPGVVFSYQILSKGYKPGLIASIRIDSNRILLMNCLLEDLYQVAYGGLRRDLHFALAGGFPRNRVILNVKDSTDFIWSTDHLNEYSYDLFFPFSFPNQKTNIDSLFFIMQSALTSSLPYEAKVIKKKVHCLVLIRQPGFKMPKVGMESKVFEHDAFSLNMKNYSFALFVNQLRYYFLQKEIRPLIDETGITEPVDMTLNTNLSNPAKIAKALQPYGIDLIEADREIEMLVITDKSDSFTSLQTK